MQASTCRVDNQGRISLPSKLRELAGIQPGDEVLLCFEDGGIMVATREAALKQAQRIAREYLGEKVDSLVDDFLTEKRQIAALEAKEAAKYGRHRKTA